MGINFLTELWVGTKCAFSKPVTLDKNTILDRANHNCTQLSIEPAKCIACRTCMRICPNRCIQIIDKKHFTFDATRCTNCHLCQKACPKNAINWE